MDELFRVRADRIHYGQVLGKYRKEFEEREKERKVSIGRGLVG